ncbi:hypothetical protein J437_LFUL007965 [Ladona fulva]|uniref:Uncharacterized protein n=1 Tax=Ladona fulva TaxID=123851 RepID=A0A8K0KF03_LADFU|nr:hypothetical protein J437_LFUL007965 [Ladona fulva]
MERWRKSLAHCAPMASSNSTRRSAKKETNMLLKVKRQMNGESSNIGSMWRPKVHSSRKSIPRRLSYSKHDDSISLMNIGNNLDDTIKSTPMKLETVPVVKVSNFDETKKKEDDDEELGVKKDTLEYLKSIGVIGNSNSQQKGKVPTVPAKNVSSAKKTKILPSATKLVQTNTDISKESFCHSDQVKDHIQSVNVIELQNDTNLVSLQQKVKELLMKQTKEKSELKERYEIEVMNLEKSHEKELIDLFNPSAQTNKSEPVAVTDISMSENHISQEIMSQDSFLKSPFSGTWRVSHLDDDDDDDLVSNDTPTLGINSISNVTINGQQFLDTPATRRLVTQRITQGIETLFFK